METLPRSHSLEPGEPRFQLQAPPNELWSLTRLCNEFGVSQSTIYEWIRSGRLPQPWLRRKGKSSWAPETVRPALERYWLRMGRDKREARE
jgi:predicted DNA-binding transcriptional regulator AlpA